MNVTRKLSTCAVTALFISACVAAQPTPGPFGPISYYATGAGPRVVLRADLTGSGYPNDLVTVNRDTNDLTVFVNDDHGTYKASRVPVGAQPGRVNALDINNDGKTDLVVLNHGDSTVQILINDGAGGFTTTETLSVGKGSDRQLTWKSGRNSRVVISNRDENTISYFAFGPEGSVIGSSVVPVGKQPTAMQNIDLDGDSIDELLVLNSEDGTVSIVERESGAVGLPRSVVATIDVERGPTAFGGPVDLDGDGKRDLIVANQDSGTISVLRSRGDRTFDVVHYRVGSDPGSINTGDFNGDGMTDLIVGNRGSGTLSVLLNEGHGSFSRAVHYPAGNGPNFPVVADMNGDGISDVVVSNSNDGSVMVLEGAGDGTFTQLARIQLRAGITTRGSTQLVESNNDGNPAIAVVMPAAHQLAIISNFAAGFVRVVEYSRKRADGSEQYFMTPVKAEIEALDSGAIAGWTRSGDSFRGYERAGENRNAVCRFFSPRFDSHFYSSSSQECASVYKWVWGNAESEALFFVPTAAAGGCLAGSSPVYRLYDRVHTNHRHTLNKAKRDAAVASGWISEGIGPDGIAMCAP